MTSKSSEQFSNSGKDSQGNYAKECLNDGICIFEVRNDISEAICSCPQGFEGENCELQYCFDDNEYLQRCYNGICKDNLCLCGKDSEGNLFQGVNCEEAFGCSGTPCQNGGNCNVDDISDKLQACLICFKIRFIKIIYYKDNIETNKRDLNAIVSMALMVTFANVKSKLIICFLYQAMTIRDGDI